MIEKLKPGCTHGQIIKSSAITDFVLTESVYQPMSQLPKHAHENSYFCFVVKGIYTEKFGGKELICKPSTVTFRSAGEIHEDRFHTLDGRIFVVEIPPKWIERLKEESLNLNSTVEFRQTILPKLTARLYQEFYLADKSSFLALEGIIYEMLAEASRQSARFSERKIPLWLKSAHDLLVERFAENLTLQQVAAEVNIHPIYFSAVFKQKYGCTVGEFARQLRIEFACREILKNKLSLAEIALESGFADQSHFSKTFKLYTGITPSAYKNLYPKQKS